MVVALDRLAFDQRIDLTAGGQVQVVHALVVTWALALTRQVVRVNSVLYNCQR